MPVLSKDNSNVCVLSKDDSNICVLNKDDLQGCAHLACPGVAAGPSARAHATPTCGGVSLRSNGGDGGEGGDHYWDGENAKTANSYSCTM